MRPFRRQGKAEQAAPNSPYKTAASRSAEQLKEQQPQARAGTKLNPLPSSAKPQGQSFLPGVDAESMRQARRSSSGRSSNEFVPALHSPSQSPKKPQPAADHASRRTQEKEAELDKLVAQYKDAMKKVNLEREVLQSEVQRVVGLEKQREEELTHAVEVNDSLMAEIQELQDSLSNEGVGSAQQKLIDQLQKQIDSLCNERDKALMETDQLYEEVQLLRSQGPGGRQQQPSGGDLGVLQDLAVDVNELAEDLEHGYKVLEGFKEDLDHQELEINKALDALYHDKTVLGQEISSIQEELMERLQMEKGMSRLATKELKALRKQAAEGGEWQAMAVTLEENLKEKDAQLQRSLDMRKRLEEELEETKKQLPESEAGRAPLSATSGSLDISSVNASMEAGLRQQVEDLAEQLREEQLAHKKAKEALAAVHGAVEEAAAREQELQDEARQSRLKEDALRAELGKLEEALMAAAEEQHERAAAQDEATQLRGDVQELKGKLDVAEEELEEIKASTEGRELEELQRKLKEARLGREAAEENMREAMSTTSAMAQRLRETEETASGLAQRLRDEEASSQDLQERLRAATKLAEQSQAAAALAEEQVHDQGRERPLGEEIARLKHQLQTSEARSSVLTRELQASEAQALELRRALKGTGMLSEVEAAELRREACEAKEEAKLMREKSALLEQDVLGEVYQELSAVKDSLSEARRGHSSVMKEETEARQQMQRQLRRVITDLQQDRRRLAEEVETLRQALPSRAGRGNAGNRLSQSRPEILVDDFPVPQLCASPDQDLRELEQRNLQVQYESRMLRSDQERRSGSPDNRKSRDRNRDRLFKEARDVHAESEFRLKETVASHEDLMLRTANLMAMSDGWTGRGSVDDELMSDRKYRQIRGHIEDLEERLMRKISSSANTGQDAHVTSRQLQELLNAQRDVGEALRKLVVGQSMMQDRQDRHEAKQGLKQIRSSLEMLDALHSRGRSESPTQREQGAPAGQAPTQHPLAYSTPGGLHASFSDWTHTPPMPYTDRGLTPPSGIAPVHLSPMAAFAPPSVSKASLLQDPSAGGVLLSNLYQYAPPSWRAARGMTPAAAAAQPTGAGKPLAPKAGIMASRLKPAEAPPLIAGKSPPSSRGGSIPGQRHQSPDPIRRLKSAARDVPPQPAKQSPANGSGEEAEQKRDLAQPSPEEVAPSAAYASDDSRVNSPTRRSSSPWRSPWEEYKIEQMSA